MSLHSRQVEVTTKLLGRDILIAVCRESLCMPGDEFVRPLDVTVSQQRSDVVGIGTFQRTLKVEDAGIVFCSDHQVARMIIPVNEHTGLIERLLDEQIATGLPLRFLAS